MLVYYIAKKMPILRSWSRKIISVCCAFFCIVFGVMAIDTCQHHQFKRVLPTSPVNRSLYLLSSNTEIPSRFRCYEYCNSHSCSSFSYTSANQTCDMYSTLLTKGNAEGQDNTTVYYTRDISSGVYPIVTTGGKKIDAYLELDDAGEVWTVIQRRTRGSAQISFNRNWAEFKTGFGDPLGDVWIGNENIHYLTATAKMLFIEMGIEGAHSAFVIYSTFQVANEDDNYRLTVRDMLSGNFTDAMYKDALQEHDGAQFSTYDRDNDDDNSQNVAIVEKGGWWFGPRRVNLNTAFDISAWPNFAANFPTWSTSKMMIR